MRGDHPYDLTVTIANPWYRPWSRRGLRSIREFRAGLPIIVHRTPDRFHNFFSWSKISVDIPVLRLRGISDLALVDKLLKASLQRRPPPLPTGETYVACAKCFGTSWRNTMSKNDQKPMRALCITCGNEITVLRLLHQPGHA